MHRDNTDSTRRRLAGTIIATLLAGLVLAACGGDESETTDPAAGSGDQAAEQPAPTAEGGGSSETTTTTGEPEEKARIEREKTDAERCPDVTITENSGNGLFGVSAEGISCEDATAALEEWGNADFPGEGPEGFTCRPISSMSDGPPTRLRCESDDGAIEFATGV